MQLLQHKFDQEQNARRVKNGLAPIPVESKPATTYARREVAATAVAGNGSAAVAPATPMASAPAQEGNKKAKKGSLTKFHFSPFTIIMYVVLIVYVFSMFFMVGWAVMSSFKSSAEFNINTFGLPKKLIWWYSSVFKKFKLNITRDGANVDVGMAEMFINALIYSVGCSLTSAFMPMMTAYLVAKFDFKFGKFIYGIVIITMILPIVGSTPSELMFARFFGLYDELWGLAIMRGHFLGMNFLIYHAMWKALPNGYTEAAKIDGAGNMAIFIKIMLPFARNLFFTIVLINFIGFWNDYQTPLFWMPSYPTIAYGMYVIKESTDNAVSAIPAKMAAAVLMLIPILILFAAFQKKLLGNLTIGGLKG